MTQAESHVANPTQLLQPDHSTPWRQRLQHLTHLEGKIGMARTTTRHIGCCGR